MTRESVRPNVHWTEIEPPDLLPALKTLRLPTRSFGAWRGVETPGESVDTYVSWARDALNAAEQTTDANQQNRHGVEAVGHAKRALDRLFDLYLRRDWLHLRLRERASFTERLDLLRRRMGARLPSRLIPAVIADPRNEAEHEFNTPTLDEAARAVEAAEMVSSAMRSASDPIWGPAFLGVLLGGSASSAGKPTEVWFEGFGSKGDGFALWWCGQDAVVRVGAGRVIDNVTAEVNFTPLEKLDVAEHFDLLLWWDGYRMTTGEGESFLRRRLLLAGLDHPV